MLQLSNLPLRPSTLQLLTQRGFTTVEEVQEACRNGRGLSNFAAELGTTIAAAGGVWREIKQIQNDDPVQKENHATQRPRTAQEILSQHEGSLQKTSIITFCREIDQLLGGGIALGELTEIAGSPGAGKTQWGMQLSVNACLPQFAGGVQGEAVYVDTEGSFSPERCYVMAEALLEHVRANLKKRRRRSSGAGLEDWTATPEMIMEGIHVVRVHDEAALQATLQGTLPKLAKERQDAGSPIRIVVVDSMAFPIRATPPPSLDPTATIGTAANAAQAADGDFYVSRTRQLNLFATQLAQIAATYRLAAVAINQMTTRVTGGEGDEGGQLVPALGDSWAHAVTTRIILSASGVGEDSRTQARRCSLVKSPRLPGGSEGYIVTEGGVRDVGFRPSSSGNASGRSAQKRQEPDS